MLKNLLLLLLVPLSALSIAATTPVPKEENYASGYAKITEIIFSTETGLAAHRTNIRYAETRNIEQDLNIKEIADFFACKTKIGNSFLIETLKNPVLPEEMNGVILQRQNIIKALVNNPEFKTQIEDLLSVARQAEQEVIILLSDTFKASSCPQLQAIKQLREQGSNGLANFIEWGEKSIILKTSNFIILPTYTVGGGALSLMSIFTMLEQAYTGRQANIAESALCGAYFGLLTYIFGSTFYKEYSTGAEKRDKLFALNQLVKIATCIENVYAWYGVESEFKVSTITNPETLKLLQALQHPRYNEKESWIFAVPLVHVFLHSVYEKEKQLFTLFASIAEMDAYNAIATKIIESQSQKNKFCFVNCQAGQQKTPIIRTNDFWNVLVKNPIANNFFDQKNVILTGPNAGGKSTSIKAIMQNMLFAQTYGFAAATTWETTPFDVIHSYVNISDDIINGLSLFASEIKRAKEIIERIKVLKPEQKYFFALDELFTGTGAEAGEKIAYDFIERLAGSHGIQFFYATHFNRLKELGNKNTRCANYKVDAPTQDTAGKLKYPFTLSNGASDVNIAMAMAQEANLFT